MQRRVLVAAIAMAMLIGLVVAFTAGGSGSGKDASRGAGSPKEPASRPRSRGSTTVPQQGSTTTAPNATATTIAGDAASSGGSTPSGSTPGTTSATSPAPTATTAPPSCPPPSSGTVAVMNNLFSPTGISVSAGTTVTWAFNGNCRTHTVTSDTGLFDSGNKKSGTFSHTFSTPGT